MTPACDLATARYNKNCMRNGKPERSMWVCHNFFLGNTWQLHRERAAGEQKRDHVMNEIIMEKDSREELELAIAALGLGLEIGDRYSRDFLGEDFAVRPA